MTLHELAVKYGSDKADHGYLDFYEQTLPEKPKKLLEIGVKKGASIRMWKEWFPDTEIHGLDLFQEFNKPEIDGVTWHKGNQCDWKLLEQLRTENFDVVIDDGSHNSRDQMMTFFGLFNGNHYYIEDLHCCHSELFGQGLPEHARAWELFNSLDNSQCKLNILRTGNVVLIKQ